MDNICMVVSNPWKAKCKLCQARSLRYLIPERGQPYVVGVEGGGAVGGAGVRLQRADVDAGHGGGRADSGGDGGRANDGFPMGGSHLTWVAVLTSILLGFRLAATISQAPSVPPQSATRS